jgi:transcriptional regulator with GAF, ATPase, and Fis domain
MSMSDWSSPIPPEQSPAPSVDPVLPQYRVARADAIAAFERTYLRRLIESTNGNASAAARAANMDRPYLLSLLRRHGLR